MEHKRLRWVFVTVVLFIATASYVAYGYGSARQRLQGQLSEKARDMGERSHWFQTLKEGKACQTWITCKAAGALIKEIHIEHDGVRYPLGSIQLGRKHVDIFGKSPADTAMTLCRGKDEGVSMKIGKSTRESRYNDNKDDVITVTIKADEEGKEKLYYYDLPAGFDPNSDNTNMTIVFEAKTGDALELYKQSSPVGACSL